MNRYLILGASRGLGADVARLIDEGEVLLVARKMAKLKQVATSLRVTAECFSFDLTHLDSFDVLFDKINKFSPTHIFYIAGGGPHGLFASKSYKDHLWAYRLNLLAPAKLIHWALNNLSLKQLIITGSSVAEGKADPLASSYASAKHGLKGLVASLREEKLNVDLRLFSPSYMETDLLPKNSEPYSKGQVKSSAEIAKLFYEWSNDANGLWHCFIGVA